ncbi:hypothetical protein CANARDRAFT_28664 [[Candida] arabinofermentans NRRL YB-2248]|uniref:Ubiquitin carboxyl-terminal hydrolase 2 n=1 Tax=[Candida] arabinofermentans NRRL YB-2248 TaxID=983967 RepID=A0A1E4SZK5_9ASCO|nr:hypothetical protein CANARDRAFT_28664 [[Candida] arabinofermentans NRRL YB-2248]
MVNTSLPPGYTQSSDELNELYPSSSMNEALDQINDNDLVLAPCEDEENDDLQYNKQSDPMSDVQYTENFNEPPALPIRRYSFQNAEYLKTTDRILDDIRNDPFFFLSAHKDNENSDFNRGILSEDTLDYAERLNKHIVSTSKHYQLKMLSTSNEALNINKVEKLNDGKFLWTFNGIIVPKVDISIPTTPIFHFKIKIKGFENTSGVKHKLYYFDDDQLFAEDRKDLILDHSRLVAITSQYSNEEEQYHNRVIGESLPEILDSANYICQRTGLILRVEVYPPVLDYDDFKDFENEETQFRVTSFFSQYSNSNINVEFPNTFNCLYTLFKVLKGPLTYMDSEDKKTLKPHTSQELNLNLNLNLLTKKLFFREIDNELHPPAFRELGEYFELGRDYFIRAITEVLHVAIIFAPNQDEFFKTKINFNTDMNEIFKVFNEPEYLKQVQMFDSWSEYQYSTAFTTLSSCTYYNDATIIDLYNTYVDLNPGNVPEYFDALTFCSTSRNGHDLQIYMTTLRSQGVIGFQELKSLYMKLGVDITIPEMEAQLTDQQLIDAYKANLVLCSTKYERATYREALDKIGSNRQSTVIRSFLETEPLYQVSEAYDVLEVDQSVDDDIIITAYQLKAEDSNYYNPLYARAILTVALNRKSLMLINFIDSNLPQFSKYSSQTFEQACKVIGCDSYADDSTIIRIFQERVNKEVNADFQELWTSLKKIGDVRSSKLIEGFLSTGIIDSSLLSIDKSPAGLNNIGNTCYLNSLLQFYFVIEPLRTLVLEFNKTLDMDLIENNESFQCRRIGGRRVGYKETERSYQFMYQLRDLYNKMIHANQRCVQPTKELAYLAFSPISEEVEFEDESDKKDTAVVLYDSPHESPSVEVGTVDTEGDSNMDLNDAEEKTEETTPNTVEEENQVQDEADSSIDSMQDAKKIDSTDVEDSSSRATPSTSAASSPKQEESIPEIKTAATAKISADQIENALEIGRQQDVTECIENVLIQIESALEPEELDADNEQLDIIKQMFYGKTKQVLMPVDPETKEELDSKNARTKEERFLNLIVNIGDHPKDIYDALDTYFTEDLLKLDGDEEVKRSLTITQLPNILQIQIQRVQFDRERLIPVKSIEPLPFKEKLYIDRYLDTTDEVLIAKRKEVFHWKHRIGTLNERKSQLLKRDEHGLTIKETLESARQFLESSIINEIGVLIDSNTLEVLDRQIAKLGEELKSINSEIEMLQNQIQNQFVDMNKIGYSIFAIFIHRGQASYGHYWIYIKDPKSGLYRKYNDEIVSEVTIDEVLNFSESNSATPYYLVFVKDELVDLVQPLKREIIEEAIVV